MALLCGCLICDTCGGSGAVQVDEDEYGPEYDRCPDCAGGTIEYCPECSADRNAAEFAGEVL